jgi:hypothetical protein
MNATILCSGPSLASFVYGDQDGLVIAVNRAAINYGCSVWAAGDYPLVEKIRDEVIGAPTLLTAANSAAYLRDHGPAWRGPVKEFEDLLEFCPGEIQWQMFTATAALVYAAASGATLIHVYGADWRGTEDFDGTESFDGGNRSPERWTFERSIWNNLTAWLARRGVTVVRYPQTAVQEAVA